MLIGFTGKAGAGKTTAALHLQKQCRSRKGKNRLSLILSFADPIKQSLAVLLNEPKLTSRADYGTKSMVDKYVGIPYRTWMQKFGTEFVRKMMHPCFWVRVMEDRILTNIEYYDIYIDDIRFNEEALLIKKYGGIIIKVERETAENNLWKKFLTWKNLHKSEKGISKKLINKIVINPGDGDFFDNLEKILE